MNIRRPISCANVRLFALVAAFAVLFALGASMPAFAYAVSDDDAAVVGADDSAADTVDDPAGATVPASEETPVGVPTGADSDGVIDTIGVEGAEGGSVPDVTVGAPDAANGGPNEAVEEATGAKDGFTDSGASGGAPTYTEDATPERANDDVSSDGMRNTASSAVLARSAAKPTTFPASNGEPSEPSASITYGVSLVGDAGKQAAVTDGKTAGSATANRNINGIYLQLDTKNCKGSIDYQVYVKGKGWVSASGGALASTGSKTAFVNAIRAKLQGDVLPLYSLYYRVYVDDLGWLGWASDYQNAGTGVSFNRALQAVQFKLIEKDGAAPSSSGSVSKAAYVDMPKVSVQAHVQRKGWMAAVGNNTIAGTTGQSLRLEALKISITSAGVTGGATYDSHVQRVGWQPAVGNGKVSGTTGKSLRMEALELGTAGDMSKLYDVYYRVHVQNYGWLDWAEAQAMAGSTGRSLRMEAVQVYVTLKGSKAPGKTEMPAIMKRFYLDAGHGWSGYAGYDCGAVGSGYQEADLTKALSAKVYEYATKTYHLSVYNPSTKGKPGVNYSERQADALSHGCSAFISIHFNATGAGQGAGTETYAYTSAGKQLQAIVGSSLRTATSAAGLVWRGNKTAEFAVVRGKVPSVLCEICFIDNPSDMGKYDAKRDSIAQAIAKGMYEASKQGF